MPKDAEYYTKEYISSSKELYNRLLPLIESFKEDDTETINNLVDMLKKHFGYDEFSFSRWNNMKQLGYLFQQLESLVNKETK